MRTVLILASATLLLIPLASPAHAQPGGECGGWTGGGESTVDAACEETATGRSCLLWLYALRDNLREICAEMRAAAP